MVVNYLVEWNFTGKSGVERKVLNQISCWISMGHSVELTLLSTLKPSPDKIPPGTRLSYYKTYESENTLGKILNLILKHLYIIIVCVKSSLGNKPRFVYYRVSGLNLAAVLLSKVFPVVLEVNSVLEDEVTSSRFKSIYWNYYRSLFASAAANCFITAELKDYYSEKFGLSAHKAIISGNGYMADLNHELIVGPKASSKLPQRVPTAIFVGGHDHPWNGYDKVVRIAECLPQYHFIVVSGGTALQEGLPNVTHLPFADEEELKRLYERSDIGIGTLALHRKSMKEASPLKVREYIHFGLPVIIGYVDSDLLDAASCDVLMLENTEDNILPNIGHIESFIFASFNHTIDPALRQNNLLINKERKKFRELTRILEYVEHQP